MKRTVLILTTVATLLACALPAQAQLHKTSLTISPIHLLMPLVEVQGEFAMTPDVGLAAILGFGSYEGSGVFEIGAQYNYYLVGNFKHGMQIGVELLYLHMSVDIDDDDRISGTGRGLGISPLLGYKTAADYGLTFNIQAGPSIILIQADAERDSDGARASASSSSVGVLLNLNIGWSF